MWTGVSLSAAVVTLTPEAPTLSIQGRDTEVTVNVAGIPDWEAKVSKGQAVTFRFNPVRVLIDIVAPAGNQGAIAIRLPDGATAEVGATGAARFDWFKDQTYYLVGNGGVTGTNADGQKFVLSAFQPPMVGGPIVVTTDANRVKHTARLSPVTPIKVEGFLGDELIVRVGAQQVTVPVDGSRMVTLPNGTELKMTQSLDTRTLRWAAVKGYLQLKVDDVGQWQANGLTGQSAAMQWSSPQQTGLPGQIDIKNLSGDSPLLVSLSSRNFALISPQTMFQYSQGTGPQFVASAVGGDVTLFNIRTGTETTLHPNDLSFRGGGLDLSVGGLSWQPVTVFGDEQTLLRVRGENTNIALRDDADHVLSARNGNEFTVGSPLRGTLGLRSTTGDHAIDFQVLPGWTIYLPEGQSLTFEMDMRRGVLSATAGGNNTSVIRITTNEGFSPVLPPDTTITFRLQRFDSPLAGGTVKELILPPVIVQPPVTVVR